MDLTTICVAWVSFVTKSQKFDRSYFIGMFTQGLVMYQTKIINAGVS